MEGLVSNSTILVNETELFQDNYVGYGNIALQAIYLIMLVMTILSCLLLTYITYHHGYGSRVNNFLVINWILFKVVFLITGSILHFFLHFLAKISWPLGISGCGVTQFLENITVLPVKTIPIILCFNIYKQVFTEKKVGFLSKMPSTIWVTAAVWIVIFDCVLGSIYGGRVAELYHSKVKRCFHEIAVEDGPVASMHIFKICYEFLWGSVVPLISIITIGVFTVKQTKGRMPLPKSAISDKLKVRELILAVMGLTIICRIFGALELVFDGKNVLLHWLLSITLALVCCQRELWKGCFGRVRKRDDLNMHDMLS